MEKLVLTFWICIISCQSYAQAEDFGLVTFSKTEEEVLVYDQYMKLAYSVDIYHLFKSNFESPILSIISADSNYYEIDSEMITHPEYLEQDFFKEPSNLNKGKIVNTQLLRSNHGLMIKGVDISDNIEYIPHFDVTEKRNSYDQDSTIVGHHFVKDIEIKWVYLDDTIKTYDVLNVPLVMIEEFESYLEDTFEYNKPYPSYDDLDILKGYINSISYVFRDESFERFFFYSNFSSPIFRNVGKDETKLDADTMKTSWIWYTYNQNKIRTLKYR